jgi:hypothetical protein
MVMRRQQFRELIVSILPIAVSIFLLINYLDTVNGGFRIPSETGYYVLLVMVAISCTVLSFLKPLALIDKSKMKTTLQICLMLLIWIGLDMVLHVLTRTLTSNQNAISDVSGGIRMNMPLIQSALKIYGVRFISVLLIGNIFFWGGTKIRLLRLR